MSREVVWRIPMGVFFSIFCFCFSRTSFFTVCQCSDAFCRATFSPGVLSFVFGMPALCRAFFLTFSRVDFWSVFVSELSLVERNSSVLFRIFVVFASLCPDCARHRHHVTSVALFMFYDYPSSPLTSPPLDNASRRPKNR